MLRILLGVFGTSRRKASVRGMNEGNLPILHLEALPVQNAHIIFVALRRYFALFYCLPDGAVRLVVVGAVRKVAVVDVGLHLDKIECKTARIDLIQAQLADAGRIGYEVWSPKGRRKSWALRVVCRPLPSKLRNSPTLTFSFGWMAFMSALLPTPLGPVMTVNLSVSSWHS